MNGQCIIIERMPLHNMRHTVGIVDLDKMRTIRMYDNKTRHGALLIAKSWQTETGLAVRERHGNDLCMLPQRETLDYGILFK